MNRTRVNLISVLLLFWISLSTISQVSLRKKRPRSNERWKESMNLKFAAAYNLKSRIPKSILLIEGKMKLDLTSIGLATPEYGWGSDWLDLRLRGRMKIRDLILSLRRCGGDTIQIISLTYLVLPAESTRNLNILLTGRLNVYKFEYQRHMSLTNLKSS